VVILNSIEIFKNRINKTYSKVTYEYLLDNVLYSKKNPVKLRERVRELYYDLLEFSDTPDIYRMAEMIDDENIFIIIEFYKDKYTEEEIDNVIASYDHNVACMLDEWIYEILQDWGYSCSGDPFYIFENKNNINLNLVAQNELFEGFD